MKLVLTVNLEKEDTFGDLDYLVSFLRERGNAEFRPIPRTVVATFDVEPAEEFLRVVGMEGDAYVALVLGAKELVEDIERELHYRGFHFSRCSWERG